MKSSCLSLSIALISLLFFTQCNNKNKDDEQLDTFKKEGILQNLADNYVVPGYVALQLNVNTLQDSWNTFLTTPSLSNLDALKSNWRTANSGFQRIKMIEVGPALTVGLGAALGTFPADTSQIEANITAGIYNLASSSNIDAIGFEALDYLFYGNDALNKLTNSPARRNYVSSIISKMKTEVDQVTNEWTGGYKATFIAGTSTSSTSPFALLVNAFCKDFELAKTAKIGIPIGTQSLGIQQPVYLEARRSGFGKELLIENIRGLRDVFQGNFYTSGTGISFDDYLNALEKQSLSTTISTRFEYMVAQPTIWTESIESMMSSNPQTLTDYYNYLQGSVVYMKTDMASAFGVLITYQDNDGD